MRKKHLAVSWIDYKKAYDMIPHPWIVKCLGLVGVSEQIKLFLSESMNAWNVGLTCNNQSLGRVDIKRVIFQGDSLSPLLFVPCLIPLTLILHKSESAYQFSSTKESHPRMKRVWTHLFRQYGFSVMILAWSLG